MLRTFPFFLESVNAAPGFTTVYETDDVVVFERE
jgi:hypothetical protein